MESSARWNSGPAACAGKRRSALIQRSTFSRRSADCRRRRRRGRRQGQRRQRSRVRSVDRKGTLEAPGGPRRERTDRRIERTCLRDNSRTSAAKFRREHRRSPVEQDGECAWLGGSGRRRRPSGCRDVGRFSACNASCDGRGRMAREHRRAGHNVGPRCSKRCYVGTRDGSFHRIDIHRGLVVASRKLDAELIPRSVPVRTSDSVLVLLPAFRLFATAARMLRYSGISW